MSTGKGTKSIRKSQQGNDIIPSVGFLNTVAKHKATLGQTVINISSLTVPPEATALGFVQPSSGTLAAIDLQRFKNNVQVSSSFRGLMDNPLDYQITGMQQITLRVAALENEIFTISMQARPRVGTTLVAAQPKVQSYTLLAGNTTIPVGPFTVNANPGTDVGDFMVIIDKTVMRRNTDNSAPAFGIDGDYYEATGVVNVNTPDLTNDRRVTLVWVGALVDNPQDSQLALIQVLGGQIDAIIPTLAALAGVPESTFQTAPNDVDLAAFGATVLSQGNRITAVETTLATPKVFLNTVSALKTPLNAAWANMTGNSLALSVSGLYKITADYLFSNGGASPNYTDMNAAVFAANGNDTGVVPTPVIVSPSGPVTFVSASGMAGSSGSSLCDVEVRAITNSNRGRYQGVGYIRINGPITLYSVMWGVAATPANMRFTTSITAERIGD